MARTRIDFIRLIREKGFFPPPVEPIGPIEEVDPKSAAEIWALSGHWTSPRGSSFVNEMRYNAVSKVLSVKFVSGWHEDYRADLESAVGFYNASSLGKYVHAHYYRKTELRFGH